MTLPLVYRHGAAETVFIIAVLAWVVFEAVMRTIQRLGTTGPSDDRSYFVLAADARTRRRVRALRGRTETARARSVVMAAEIQGEQADFPADLGAVK